MLLQISAPALSRLQSAIVESTHGLMTIQGQRASIGTIDPKYLRIAALMAVQLACGESVLGGDQQIQLDPPTQHAIGPFLIGNR